MNKKIFVRGLLISLILFFIASIIGYFTNFYFKIFFSLFLINLTLLFLFKFNFYFKREKLNKLNKENLSSNEQKVIIKVIKLLFIYGIPILILCYIFYFNFLPLGFEKVFFLDIGNKRDINGENEIYLLDIRGRISNEIKEGNVGYRSISNTPIYFFIKPPKGIINKLTEIDIKLKLKNSLSKDISIRIGTNNKNGEILWKNIYIPDFEEFKLIGDVEDYYLYSKTNIPLVNDPSQSLENWLVKNIPRDSKIFIDNRF